MTLDEFDSEIQRLMGAICTIFIGEPSGILHSFGSGVFITLSNHIFLLTAAHVITDRDIIGDLLVEDRSGGLIYLPKFHARHTIPISNGGGNERLDLAYCKLEKSFAAQLNPFFTFIDINDINLFDSTKFGDVYSMVGFPGESPIFASEVKFKERFAFTGDACDPKQYRKLKFNPQHYILVSFNRNKVKRIGSVDCFQTRNRYVAPKPHGMSGGALFAAYEPDPDKKDSRPTACLAGILTTYYPSEHTFVATRINCFINFILANNPEIPRTYVRPFNHSRNG